MTNKQRVGSFRSRLKKQQPIMMSEPPMGSISPGAQEAMKTVLATATSTSVDYPCVAVTVHKVIDSNQEICDL